MQDSPGAEPQLKRPKTMPSLVETLALAQEPPQGVTRRSKTPGLVIPPSTGVTSDLWVLPRALPAPAPLDDDPPVQHMPTPLLPCRPVCGAAAEECPEELREAVLLCEDLMKLVFAHLSLEELCKAGMVRVRWHEMTNDPSFWRVINLEGKTLPISKVRRQRALGRARRDCGDCGQVGCSSCCCCSGEQRQAGADCFSTPNSNLCRKMDLSKGLWASLAASSLETRAGSLPAGTVLLVPCLASVPSFSPQLIARSPGPLPSRCAAC